MAVFRKTLDQGSRLVASPKIPKWEEKPIFQAHTTTTTKVSDALTRYPNLNTHANWIETQKIQGGLNSYIENQRNRYMTAIQNNDLTLIGKLEQDMKRIGFSNALDDIKGAFSNLTGQMPIPTQPTNAPLTPALLQPNQIDKYISVGIGFLFLTFIFGLFRR